MKSPNFSSIANLTLIIILLSLTGQVLASENKWRVPTTTFYTDDLNGAEGLWKDSFKEAAARWNDTATSFRINTKQEKGTGFCTSSGTNSARFQSTLCGDEWGANTLAVTQSFASGGYFWKTDIIFNGAKSWNVYDNVLRSYARDFQRVAAHELGHAIGLNHLENENALMYETISNTFLPQFDDVNALLRLYGKTQHTLTLVNNGPGYIQVRPSIDGTGFVNTDTNILMNSNYEIFDCHSPSCELSIQDGLRLSLRAIADFEFISWTGTNINSSGLISAPFSIDRTLTANYTDDPSTLTPIVPSAPGISASDTRVLVAWPPLNSGEIMSVFRCTTNFSNSCGESIGTSTITYLLDPTGVAGTTYYYRLKLCNSSSCSGFSNPSPGKRTIAISIPTSSSKPVTSASTTEVAISWESIGGATSYEVYRCLSQAIGSCGDSISSASGTSYNDVGGVAGVNYFYRIKSCSSAGCSEFGDYTEGTRTIAISIPNPPSKPVITASTTEVAISWESIGGATSYEVYRCLSQAIGSCGVFPRSTDAISWTDLEGVAGTDYYYRVKACNSAGCSEFSNYSLGTKTGINFATFSNNQLTIPRLSVETIFGNFYYSVVLQISNTIPFYDFTLTSSIEIDSVQGSSYSTFSTGSNMLKVHKAQIGNSFYRIDFQLFQEDESVFFRLINAEEI